MINFEINEFNIIINREYNYDNDAIDFYYKIGWIP